MQRSFCEIDVSKRLLPGGGGLCVLSDDAGQRASDASLCDGGAESHGCVGLAKRQDPLAKRTDGDWIGIDLVFADAICRGGHRSGARRSAALSNDYRSTACCDG